MTKRGALSWCWALGALLVAASCAQGSADNADDGGIGAAGDAGPPRESIDASFADAGGTNPVGNDSGPLTGNDSGSPVSDDSGPGPDTGTGDDAAAPPPPDAGKKDSGTDAGTSAIPTTCAQADQGVGCCYGNVNYYCTVSNTVAKKTCSSTQVCGWSTSKSYYDCVAPPGGSDPSGVHPIACK